MARNYKQGLFKPSNPSKYAGDVHNIVYRSSWEARAFMWADSNPSVIQWSSEETIIPYICGTDNQPHRYFVDLRLKIRNAEGKVAEYIVEIKPYAQTLPPKVPKRQTQRYINEVETYIKNQSKWEAAKRYARERNMQFVILTEKEIFGTK